MSVPKVKGELSALENQQEERKRRLTLTISTSALSRVATMIVPLVTTPLTYNYFGAERYGLWMTVTSITSMFVFADLGLGNGLLTKVGSCFGNDDEQGAQRYITSGYFLVGSVSLLLFSLLCILSPVIPWANIFNVTSSAARDDLYDVVIICFGAFLLNLPLSLIQRVQLGVQEGYLGNLWQCAAGLVSMGLIILAVKLKSTMGLVILCAVGAQPLASLLNSAYYYRFQKPQYRPNWRSFDWFSGKELLRLGLLFFILSLLTAASLYSDNIIVANVLGLEAVAEYAVPVRLASLLSMAVTMLCMPLWPANSEALARGDYKWVRENTRKMFFLSSGVVAFGSICLIAVGPEFLKWWLGADFQTSRYLLLTLSVWTLLLSGMAPYIMVLNSKGIVRFQIYAWLVFLPISIILKVSFAFSLGLSGVPLASSMAYLAVIVPSMVYAYRKLNLNHDRNEII